MTPLARGRLFEIVAAPASNPHGESLGEETPPSRIACRLTASGGFQQDLPGDPVWSVEARSVLDACAPDLVTWADLTTKCEASDAARLRAALDEANELGRSFDLDLTLEIAPGRNEWLRVIGEVTTHGDKRTLEGAVQNVSSQREAAHRAQKLAGKLRESLEAVSDAFFTLDAEWRFSYMNGAAERLLHRTRDDLVGKVIWDEFPEAVGTTSDFEYHRARREGVSVRLDQHYPPLGAWFEAQAHPSPDGLAVYFRDVTEQRKNLEQVRDSEERLRLLAHVAADAIWDWNVTTGALWWNSGFARLFGFDLDSIEPTVESWSSRIHPEDAALVNASLDEALESDAEGWTAEYRFLCKDGSYAFVRDRGHILRDGEGKAIRMLGGMTDLTERKRVEEKLREQAELLDHATDAILVRDLEHRVLYWNKSAEKLYGYTREQALGASVRELLYDDPSEFEAATSKTLAQGEWRGEIEQRTQSREPLVVQARWALVKDDHGHPQSILAINTDITQRKKLESQFLRAQRMESIGALAGGIAHDLNNTLAPILLAVSVLADEDLPTSVKEDLATIESCARRGADMVQQLLAFARGSGERRSKIHLGKVATEIQKLVRDTFPKNIAFEMSVARDLWEIEADSTQIHQVLTNLCVNARDAMPQGGTLTLAFERTVLDEVYVGMNLEARTGPYVLIRVEDNGTGMPPDVLERIFEPFFTTKQVGKGTGLGLSTAHAIVRNHGGFIHVYSENGKGTRFKIYLPADGSSVGSVDQDAEISKLPRGNGELVLVVDDEELILEVAERTLSRYGYRVVTAKNGAEAVSIYAQRRGEVAVVITDMTMPVMDGPSTIVALQSMNPKVKVIGSSGLGTNGHVAKAVGAGVRHFVPKPYTAEAVLGALKKVLLEPS